MELSNTFFVKDSDEPLDVMFDYTPYVAAHISGPPEDCYEAEGGEAEIISVCAESGNDILELLQPAIIKQLTEQAECWARECQSRGELNDWDV